MYIETKKVHTMNTTIHIGINFMHTDFSRIQKHYNKNKKFISNGRVPLHILYPSLHAHIILLYVQMYLQPRIIKKWLNFFL